MKTPAPGPDAQRVSLTADDNGIAHLRLTRGDKLNALDPAMIAALLDAGRALAEMSGLRCVVLSGEGRGFCAGLDMASMAGGLSGQPPLTECTHGNANRFQQLALQFRKLPVPVIAAVHGVCLGGGLQIAAGADIRVIDPAARLSVLEMKWGLVPDMGGFALWRGVVREDVLRAMTYTNRQFSGAEALAMGFATFAHADPLAHAMELAAEIAGKSPSAIRTAKTLFAHAADASLDQILAAERNAQQGLMGGTDQIEAVRSQLERRPARFSRP
ncbi:MAG: crotonase/enoyl-CoA hydratase family protein [Novosphingobium sp.]